MSRRVWWEPVTPPTADLERRVHWLWLAVCVGIPVALVVGAVLGHFTWGAS